MLEQVLEHMKRVLNLGVYAGLGCSNRSSNARRSSLGSALRWLRFIVMWLFVSELRFPSCLSTSG